jgi:hypothetical protein
MLPSNLIFPPTHDESVEPVKGEGNINEIMS